MGNIKNFNFNKLDIALSNSDFWDFTLANDETNYYTDVLSSICLVSLFDFNEPEIFNSGSPSTISSLISWADGINTGYTFNTIGLTGIDNGLVTFEHISGDTSNQALLSALTGTTLVILSGDTRLHLNQVTGSTNQFIYPIDMLTGSSGNYAQFCGGFYQGYYKIDGSTYKVLPERVNKGWVAEFWLKKDNTECLTYTSTTLNDLYPNNKGFFFYLGTRAENKFWNKFDGADTGCTSGCTVDSGCTDTLSPWCTITKEADILIDNGKELITLYPNQTTTTEITNKFLIYGRAKPINVCSSCGGEVSGLGNQTVCSYDGLPVSITTPKTITTNNQNPFLIYGRANGRSLCNSCVDGVSGLGNQTVCSFSGFEQSIQFDSLDYNVDVIDNALGFRIKDDGSIGYRLLTVTGGCSNGIYVSGVTIQEEYSVSGIITNGLWTSVMIRFTMDHLNNCDLTFKPNRKGRLMFYINGKLKFTVKDFPEFIGKRLNEHSEKQVGVPFNISLGGGSQGLLETQTFDGRDINDLGLPIESNFAGTFIGGISTFKFNICDLNFADIQNIYNQEVIRYS